MHINPFPYREEHKLLVISRWKPKIANAVVLTYEEELERYKTACRKHKRTKWATPEGFQLEYDSCWDDLKRAFYVYPGNKETEDDIISKLKVIEVN